MKLSAFEWRVLHVLEGRGLMRTGNVGERLWGRGRRKPQCYARPAGKVLRRLQEFGLVVWIREDENYGWMLTDQGMRRLR